MIATNLFILLVKLALSDNFFGGKIQSYFAEVWCLCLPTVTRVVMKKCGKLSASLDFLTLGLLAIFRVFFPNSTRNVIWNCLIFNDKR